MEAVVKRWFEVLFDYEFNGWGVVAVNRFYLYLFGLAPVVLLLMARWVWRKARRRPAGRWPKGASAAVVVAVTGLPLVLASAYTHLLHPPTKAFPLVGGNRPVVLRFTRVAHGGRALWVSDEITRDVYRIAVKRFDPAVRSDLPQDGLTPDEIHAAAAELADKTGLPAGVAGSRVADPSGVRLTLTDAAGNVVQTLFAEAGETVGGAGVLLRPGAYSVRIEAVRPAGYDGPVSVAVRGNRVDDPVGAVPTDPTFDPQYTDPTLDGVYIYPGDIVSLQPFYWFTLLAG